MFIISVVVHFKMVIIAAIVGIVYICGAISRTRTKSLHILVFRQKYVQKRWNVSSLGSSPAAGSVKSDRMNTV